LLDRIEDRMGDKMRELLEGGKSQEEENPIKSITIQKQIDGSKRKMKGELYIIEV
jgi:hypothetical protein